MKHPIALSRRTFAQAIVCTAVAGCSSLRPPASPEARSKWAGAIDLDGVPNLHKVTPNFYRSAQPDQNGIGNLFHSKKVRTIISLRAVHSDKPLLNGLPIRCYDVPMHTWHIEHEDIVFALRTLRHATQRTVTLVHCEHGADRTGLITALYRILYQGWSKDQALDEMEQGNFGYHDVWINIPAEVDKIDIPTLRREIAATKPTAPFTMQSS
jgi:protein tyrosine/serine phosphatase